MDLNEIITAAVEKLPPYAVGVYQLADEVLRAGTMLIERDLALIRKCREENRWPGYGDGVQACAVPQWLLRQFETITT